MELLTGAISSAVTITGAVYDAMIAQPVLAAFVGASLISLGSLLFSRMKRAAR